jgi:hypothetical protein
MQYFLSIIKHYRTTLRSVLGAGFVALAFIFPMSVYADTVTYTISDGSLTAATVSGACDTSLTNATPTDGAQGTVVGSTCVGRNDTPVVKWTKTLTWGAMGVPALAVVTAVDGSFKYRVVQETNAATQAIGVMQLQNSGDTATCAASNLEASFDPGAVNASYTTRDASGNVNVNAGCQSSETSVTLRLEMSPKTGNAAAATSELRADDVSIIITYTPAIFVDVSGTLYQSDGVTPVTTGGSTVKLRLGASTPVEYSTTTLSGSGFFRFTFNSNTWGISPGRDIIVWSPHSSSPSFTYTKASSSVNSIRDLDLIQGNLIIRHEGTSATSTSNADLSVFDYDSNREIVYDVVGNDLVVPLTARNAAGSSVQGYSKTLVASSTTFNSGGKMNVAKDFQLGQYSSWVLGGTATIGGSYFASSSAIVTTSGNSLVFSAEAGQATSTLVGGMTGVAALSDVTFYSRSGKWDIRSNASTTDFSIDAVSGYATTTATTTDIGPLYYDESSGALFAGILNTIGLQVPIIYRCSTSSGCDQDSEWIGATTSIQMKVDSFVKDSTNNVLYAGTSNSDVYWILRCALSTGCDAGSEWVVATRTDKSSIQGVMLVHDSLNNGIYGVPTGWDNYVFRCSTSTGCDQGSEWVEATTSYKAAAAARASGLAYDSVNGVVYVLRGGYSNLSDQIIRCATSTGCGPSNWTVASATLARKDDFTSGPNHLIYNPNNQRLYAIDDYVFGIPNDLISCDTSTGCDAGSEWTSYGVLPMSSPKISLDVGSNTLYLDSGSSPYTRLSCDLDVSTCSKQWDWKNDGVRAKSFVHDRPNGYIWGSNTTALDRYSTTTFGGGTVILPNQLTVSGDYSNYGTSTANGGTVYAGNGATLSGNLSGNSAFSSLVIPEYNFQYDWTNATSGGGDISQFAYDSVNKVIYAGESVNGGGKIYRCVISSGCATPSNWTVSGTTTGPVTEVLHYDPATSAIYTKSTGDSLLYRCATSTGCDQRSDWTVATSGLSFVYGRDMVLDTTNNLLYLMGGNGYNYRCDTTTGCDAGSEWQRVAGRGGNYTMSTAYDPVNNRIFNAYGDTFNSIVEYCTTSSGCAQSTDWTTATTTPSNNVTDVLYDSVNGGLYFASSINSRIIYCPVSSGCDAGSEWVIASTTDNAYTSSHIEFTHHTSLNRIYAIDQIGGGGFGTRVYYCDLVFGCGAGSTWNVATSSIEIYEDILHVPDDEALYLSFKSYLGGTPRILRTLTSSAGITTLSSNASTTNLTINTGASLDPATQLSIAGNFTNSGTLAISTGDIVYMSGTANQYATGTLNFTELRVINTTGTTTFVTPVTTSATTTLSGAGVKTAWAAGATSTLQNLVVEGTSGNEITLFSSTTGSQWKVSVPGNRSVSYARVKDSHACTIAGNIQTSNSIDATNNNCWNIGAAAPAFTQLHYIFRQDVGDESQAPQYTSEDTALTNMVWVGDRVRLRTSVSNTGAAAASDIGYRLQYASSSCSAWIDVGDYASTTGLEWKMDLSSWLADGAATTDYGPLTNPNGKTFTAGQGRAARNQTSVHALSTSQFTEHEYTVVSTSLAQTALTYCFRLSNQGSITNFTHSQRPEITLRPGARPQSGGQGIENQGNGTQRTGGGQGGGSGSEGQGGGGQQNGGGQGGGGNAE